MEAGRQSESLLDKIKPPRLEDAGLEDCALSPDSIREAFFKAASSVRSLVPKCVDDPEEAEKPSSDALVGITEGVSAPSEGCGNNKGVSESLETDDVAVIGGVGEERSDELLGVGNLPEGGEQSCVDGLAGLDIGGKGRANLGNSDKDSHDGEEGDEKSILAEGYAL